MVQLHAAVPRAGCSPSHLKRHPHPAWHNIGCLPCLISTRISVLRGAIANPTLMHSMVRCMVVQMFPPSPLKATTTTSHFDTLERFNHTISVYYDNIARCIQRHDNHLLYSHFPRRQTRVFALLSSISYIHQFALISHNRG